MHRVALVIHHAKLIEDLLRNGFYAEGKGLVDMVFFLQKVLPHDLLTEIRQIAHQRNHFAHEVNPSEKFNLFEYIRRCSEIELRLMDLAMGLDLVRHREQLPPYTHPVMRHRLNHDVESFERLRAIREEVAKKKELLETTQNRGHRLQAELNALMTRIAEAQASNHQVEKTVSDLHRLEILEKELAEKNRLLAEMGRRAATPRAVGRGRGANTSRNAGKGKSKAGAGRPVKTQAPKGRPSKGRAPAKKAKA